jgi:hypothetical protein
MVRRSGESAAEVMRRLRTKLQIEAAEVAIDALTAVAGDVRAPAPARATAGTAILRAAGFFERGEAGGDREPHEMTAEELTASIARLQRDASAVQQHEMSAAELDVGTRRIKAYERSTNGSSVFD